MARLNLTLSIGAIVGTANNLTIRAGERFKVAVTGETRPVDWFGNMDPVLTVEPTPGNDKEATFTAANPGKCLVQIQEKVPFPTDLAEALPRVSLIAHLWVTVLPVEAVSAKLTHRGEEVVDAEETDPTA